MRWLLHGPMTSAVSDSLVRHEHKVTEAAAAGLPPEAGPTVVLQAAHKGQYDLLTTDGTLAEAPFQAATPFDRTIVYLQLEGGDVEQDDAIDRLFARYKRLTPGRLYTVTASRVKVRQLPSARG
jgi:hypothetical protein